MRALYCLGHVSSPERNILELRLFYGQVGWLILQEGTKTFERNSSSKKIEPMTGLLKHMILRSHFLLYSLASFSVVFSVSFHSIRVLVVFLISGKPFRGRSVVVTHSLNGYSLSWWGRHSRWLQSNDVWHWPLTSTHMHIHKSTWITHISSRLERHIYHINAMESPWCN